MNKRIIKLLISLTVVTSVLTAQFTVAFAKSYDETVAEFLYAAGVTDSAAVPDETENVSRADFAVMAVRAMGIGDKANIFSANAFADVPSGHRAFNAVNTLYCLGFVSGTDDYLFSPDRSITLDETAKVTVHIMGYVHRVKNADYISVLTANKLLKDVSVNADGTISRTAMQKFFYNLLSLKTDKVSSWGDSISFDKGAELFMTERLGIYKIEGVVTDDGYSSLYGNSQVGIGKIVIDNTAINNSGSCDNLLGCNATAYYREDSHGTKELVYIDTESATKDIMEINADDIEDYSDCTYSYYDGDRTRKVSISRNFNIIYNKKAFVGGAALSSEQFKKYMMPEYGSVRLIKSSGGSYDTVIVNNYDCIVVGAVDSQNDFITSRIPVKTVDAAGNTTFEYKTYDFSDADTLIIRNASGTETNFDSIVSENIAEIAMSFDGKFAEVIVSANKAEGKIDSETDDGYEIGGVEYKRSKRFDDYLAYRESLGKDSPKAGDECTFYLNTSGQIEFFKSKSGDGVMFAYLADVGTGNSSMDKKLMLKLVTQDKQIKTAEVAKKAKADGAEIKDVHAAYDNLSSNFIGKIIRVRFNSDGDVDFIDTPYYTAMGNPNSATESDDSLHIVSSLGEGEKRWYSFNGGSFEGKVLTGPDTIMYVVPTKDDSEEQILVTDFQTTYKGSTWRYPTAYKTDSDSMVADLIVLNEGYSGVDITNWDTSESCTPYIVKKVYKAVDEDGNTVTAFKLTQGIGEVTKYGKSDKAGIYTHTDGTVYRVTAGDIIQFGYDKNGRIDDGNLRILYDAETDSHLFTRVTNETGDLALRVNRRSVEVYSGYVNKITQYGFELAVKDPSLGLGDDDRIIFPMATGMILKYDAERDILSSGKSSDLVDYESAGSNCSKIVLYSQSGVVKFIVVYR